MDNEKKIFIVNGFPQSGKDSFIEFCCKYCIGERFSIIDPINDILKYAKIDILHKDDRTRKLMADLKVLLDSFNNYSMNMVLKKTEKYLKSPNKIAVLFLIMRSKEDIEFFQSKFPNTKTILLEGNSDPVIFSNEADKNVKEIEYDFTIKNDGTLEELENKAKVFVKENITDVFYCNKKECDLLCLGCEKVFTDDGAIYCSLKI